MIIDFRNIINMSSVVNDIKPSSKALLNSDLDVSVFGTLSGNLIRELVFDSISDLTSDLESDLLSYFFLGFGCQTTFSSITYASPIGECLTRLIAFNSSKAEDMFSSLHTLAVLGTLSTRIFIVNSLNSEQSALI